MLREDNDSIPSEDMLATGNHVKVSEESLSLVFRLGVTGGPDVSYQDLCLCGFKAAMHRGSTLSQACQNRAVLMKACVPSHEYDIT